MMRSCIQVAKLGVDYKWRTVLEQTWKCYQEEPLASFIQENIPPYINVLEALPGTLPLYKVSFGPYQYENR